MGFYPHVRPGKACEKTHFLVLRENPHPKL